MFCSVGVIFSLWVSLKESHKKICFVMVKKRKRRSDLMCGSLQMGEETSVKTKT